MINALDAKNVFQCITHSAYREIHRDCADLLGQRMCVFKGEGGEIERRPAKPVTVQYLIDGERSEENWPATLEADHAAHDDVMDITRLKAIWHGTDTHPYAIAALTGTMAIALRLMDKADTPKKLRPKQKLFGRHATRTPSPMQADQHEKGRVILVGAGPGDPDLLTIRALRYIQSGDVIVHDRLVSDEILALAPKDVKKVFVGKAPGHHILKQEEINELLVDLAQEHKLIIRLKGGDPFVFGRGSEEAEHLIMAGIDYDVVPGITAAAGCGAAAASH